MAIEPRTKNVVVRVTPTELVNIQKAARLKRMLTSEWARWLMCFPSEQVVQLHNVRTAGRKGKR